LERVSPSHEDPTGRSTSPCPPSPPSYSSTTGVAKCPDLPQQPSPVPPFRPVTKPRCHSYLAPSNREQGNSNSISQIRRVNHDIVLASTPLIENGPPFRASLFFPLLPLQARLFGVSDPNSRRRIESSVRHFILPLPPPLSNQEAGFYPRLI